MVLCAITMNSNSHKEMGMRKFLTVSAFIENVIPCLIAGKNRLSAVFASYNRIGSRKDGLVETNKESLCILVQNGFLEYSPLAIVALLIPENDVRQAGCNLMTEEGRRSQQVLQEKLAATMPAADEVGADMLAVVYAGLSAFDEALVYARGIRGQYPQATIVILTCDCDLRRKEQVLGPLVESGEINHIVVTGFCGGEKDSEEILDGLVSAWPTTIPA